MAKKNKRCQNEAKKEFQWEKEVANSRIQELESKIKELESKIEELESQIVETWICHRSESSIRHS